MSDHYVIEFIPSLGPGWTSNSSTGGMKRDSYIVHLAPPAFDRHVSSSRRYWSCLLHSKRLQKAISPVRIRLYPRVLETRTFIVLKRPPDVIYSSWGLLRWISTWREIQIQLPGILLELWASSLMDSQSGLSQIPGSNVTRMTRFTLSQWANLVFLLLLYTLRLYRIGFRLWIVCCVIRKTSWAE